MTERCEVQRSLPLHSQDISCQLQPNMKTNPCNTQLSLHKL